MWERRPSTLCTSYSHYSCSCIVVRGGPPALSLGQLSSTISLVSQDPARHEKRPCRWTVARGRPLCRSVCVSPTPLLPSLPPRPLSLVPRCSCTRTNVASRSSTLSVPASSSRKSTHPSGATKCTIKSLCSLVPRGVLTRICQPIQADGSTPLTGPSLPARDVSVSIFGMMHGSTTVPKRGIWCDDDAGSRHTPESKNRRTTHQTEPRHYLRKSRMCRWRVVSRMSIRCKATSSKHAAPVSLPSLVSSDDGVSCVSNLSSSTRSPVVSRHASFLSSRAVSLTADVTTSSMACLSRRPKDTPGTCGSQQMRSVVSGLRSLKPMAPHHAACSEHEHFTIHE
mmetsp:Transcript_17059/g.40717  ORF Transcript_17059/g.40717 Transcript_17059/m.40717 type:complete len:339 (-) Transcript_17059:41-1057(-)